ncbi:hypothetical protein EC973_006941 [Apophysomyces ossiformis]|uniref:Cation efflux protein cytoplasmic domain-containing protein n=1 Tax=Apophysomyces ossiformis TaxID=679940 RepID=A0A8H7BV81_9FUNG|nr:hypothetical protein EC973_006941 [Apophysomyces ossiformis]
MQITLIGLAANVGLTVSKGVAGWQDDEFGFLVSRRYAFVQRDFVTLYTFKMSRKPPDQLYPYGYGKYETVGSLAVSTLLIAGAIGIGVHSFELLMTVLNASQAVAETAQSQPVSPELIHSLSHSHSHGGVLDPNAAWFALASVIVKEWLYRATIKVGKSERSDVLIANAWHHRSDAFSSVVALVAIGGSYAGLPVLDPIGGLAVSGMILKSGAGIMSNSIRELMDTAVSEEELTEIKAAISKVKSQEPGLIDFHSVRGRKMGPFNHLDLVLRIEPELQVSQVQRIEQLVRAAIKRDCGQVQEVLVLLDTGK